MAAILRSINGIKKLARFLFFTLLFSICTCRKHELRLQNEERKSFELSKFGFLKDGYLRVEVSKMVYKDQQNVLKSSELSRNFGFSLEKTASDGISPYMEQHAEQCILHDVSSFQNHISVAVFIFDLKNKRIVVNKYGSDFDNLRIGTDISFGLELDIDKTFQKEVKKTSGSSKSSNGTQGGNENKKRKENLSTTTTNTSPTAATTTASSPVTTMESITKGPQETSTLTAVPKNSIRHRRSISTYAPKKVVSQNLPLLVEKSNMTTVYSGNFTVMVKDKSEEGLYNLYFHNCANYLGKTQVAVDIHVKIVEKNDENYLSAGEEPLPFLFGIMAVLFFITACYWFYILRRNREYTFKVHYMMFVLVLLKSLDLVFESINYHFIGREGIPSRSWAVMYYITHLLKGALLFTTIVLIGTGYFFVKHVLTDRDKKIFMIVIPLQILANSAQIVMDSTEEAKIQYATWKELFILVDLLCCGAILFPVVWSIRHLQEASKTDGKAAINLAKLKLFRHFYVMIVCYIYFTRIIVYLVKITVPFQYMWFDEFFKNVASYIFFVLTGYKFRPEPDNPYLHVSQEDSDNEMEMDEVVTAQGFMEGISRKNPTLKNRDTSGVAHF